MHRLFKKTANSIRRIHSYSRNVIRGSAQLAAALVVFAAIARWIAPLTPDYFRAITYSEAALGIAPATLAAGIVSALLCDLVLRENDDDKKS